MLLQICNGDWLAQTDMALDIGKQNGEESSKVYFQNARISIMRISLYVFFLFYI